MNPAVDYVKDASSIYFYINCVITYESALQDAVVHLWKKSPEAL